ncbi:MAG: peptidylprolyl isomerase [Betaproteobacteria bacterium]|nr:peptidylprolyl isomerase [Betaproteobacteria bacterium]
MKWFWVVLSLFAVVTTAAAQEKLPAGVVAKMGDVDLRADELKQILDSASPEARAKLADSPADVDRLVRTELLRKALAAEARAKGWEKRPEVEAQMERAREQALVSSYMNNVARPPASYPSEAEIRAAYDQSRDAFAVAKQYHLEQIFVLAPPESDKTGYTKALAKVNALVSVAHKKNSDFSALAKAHSEHKESAAKGGDMGWVAENTLIPELRDVVGKMKKGEVSDAIKTPQGWHIVKLEDVREKGVRPLTEVRDQIIGALRLRRAQETERAYLTFMTNKTPVSINDAEIGKLLK